jgi:hypothetical protein
VKSRHDFQTKMDQVLLSHVIQLGEFGCLPRDILARKHEKGWFGTYKGAHDYYPFDAKLGDIVFDLEGVGGNPTAMARTMLSWWGPKDWTTLHGRIFKCMHDMFRDHEKLTNLLAGMRIACMRTKSENMTRLAILVLTHVEECNPDKQRLVVEILGEFLGAKHVRYHADPNPETFTRTCVFGDHLRHIDLAPELEHIGLKEWNLKVINFKYQEQIKLADLKKRQSELLQVYLERFVKLDKDEVQHVMSALKEKNVGGLQQRCKDIRDGKSWSNYWSRCRNQLITAFFEGCTDSDGVCGSCWIAANPPEEVGAQFRCKLHWVDSEQNPEVVPSAPPVDRHAMLSAAIVGLEEQLKQAPPQDITIVEPSAPPDDIERECGVCFKPFDCVLVPCGHICCMVCSDKLKLCHICRGPISIRQRIYF